MRKGAPGRAASRAGAAAKLLQAGAELGIARYYYIFFGYALRLPPQPASLVFPSYLQPFLKAAQILQSTTMTAVGIFIGWERDLSAGDELNRDHIGKAVYPSFVPCPALRAPPCNPALLKGMREMFLIPASSCLAQGMCLNQLNLGSSCPGGSVQLHRGNSIFSSERAPGD